MKPPISTRGAGLVLAAALGSWAATAEAAVAVQVTDGSEFSCALTAGGGVECWGRNFHGQLGNGTTSPDRTTPVGVIGLDSGVIDLDAGAVSACAVTAAGAVKCWGNNENGQLGDGTTTHRSTPVDVVGLDSGVTSVSVSGDNCSFDSVFQSHACAVTETGGVKCWGGNFAGQLGDGTNTSSSVPVDVVGLTSGVVAVSAGGCHTCALTEAGGVKCWGHNYGGRLGDGTTTDRNVPVDVVGLESGAAAVSGGSRKTCALTASGEVQCWGFVHPFQFGYLTPIDIPGFSGPVTALSNDFPGCGLVGDAAECFVLTASPSSYLSEGVAWLAVACAVLENGNVKCGQRGYGSLALLRDWSFGCGLGYGDEDGDAVCDTYDPCATAGPGGRFAAKPRSRFAVTKGNDGVAGNEGATLSGLFNLPPGTSFADLDLVASGARIVLLDPVGIEHEIALAPGGYAGKGSAGWFLSKNGRTWQYIDRTQGSAPVVRFSLVDRARGQAGGVVKATLRARPTAVPLGPDDTVDLGVALVLGDAAAGAAGLCADTTCGAKAPAMRCSVR